MNELLGQLHNTSAFTPQGAAKDLIARLDEAVREIDAQRPLPTEVLDRINTEIFYDRVHSSAVTEGNRLSRRETIVVLTTGIVEAGYRKDRIEVRNLAAAILALQEALDEDLPLNPQLLRQLHYLLIRDVDDSAAGTYRMENVAISGAQVRPPHFTDVPDYVQSVLASDFLHDDSVHVVQKAAWVHWALSRIHPFRDGNGRIARLAQDYLLLRSHYVPSTIQPEDRESIYYEALEAADLGNGSPIVEVVAKNTLRMADRYLSIIRARDAKKDWISQITRAATEKVRQTAHRRFLVVQRTINLLKNEMYQLGEALAAGVPTLEIDFRDYGSLSFEQFQDIEARGRTQDAWIFSVKLRIRESSLRYVFWVGSHRPHPDDFTTQFPCRISVLISTEEENRYFRLLEETAEDRVTIREIIPDGSLFWRRRYNPVEEKDEWDTDLMADRVAQDFFQEVFSKLGLI